MGSSQSPGGVAALHSDPSWEDLSGMDDDTERIIRSGDARDEWQRMRHGRYINDGTADGPETGLERDRVLQRRGGRADTHACYMPGHALPDMKRVRPPREEA